MTHWNMERRYPNIYGDSRDTTGMLKQFEVWFEEYASPAKVWAWNRLDAIKRTQNIKCYCGDCNGSPAHRTKVVAL